MNSDPMKDADGNTMAVTNVIILYTGVTGPLTRPSTLTGTSRAAAASMFPTEHMKT